MWKPVVVIIDGDLRLLASIGLHSPDLHPARSLGVEIDILAVRRVVGAIVQTRRRGKTLLFSAFNRNCVDIELIVPLTAEGQCLAVCRPSVPVGWSKLSDPPRRAASRRQNVDQR